VDIKSLNFLLHKGGDVDLDASPQALDRLLGCVLAFKVKVQPKFGNAVVLKYSNELDLINVVLDMLADTEVLFATWVLVVVIIAIYSMCLVSLNLYIMQPFSKMDSLVVECTDPTQAESVS